MLRVDSKIVATQNGYRKLDISDKVLKLVLAENGEGTCRFKGEISMLEVIQYLLNLI